MHEEIKTELFKNGWVNPASAFTPSAPFNEKADIFTGIPYGGSYRTEIFYPFDALLHGVADRRILLGISNADHAGPNPPGNSPLLCLVESKDETCKWNRKSFLSRPDFLAKLQTDAAFLPAQPAGFKSFARLALASDLTGCELEAGNKLVFKTENDVRRNGASLFLTPQKGAVIVSVGQRVTGRMPAPSRGFVTVTRLQWNMVVAELDKPKAYRMILKRVRFAKYWEPIYPENSGLDAVLYSPAAHVIRRMIRRFSVPK